VLVSISASHKNMPFEMLEELSGVGSGIHSDLVAAHDTIRGVVVVATCNRFEAYLDLTDDEWASPVPAVGATIDHLASLTGLSARTLRESFDFAHGNGVAHHLFSVAAGLESVALGEDEIAGQVGRSLDTSREHHTTTSELERLFQRATEASREVRNSSHVSVAGRSIVRLALNLASTRVGDWATARVLLVGTGRYAAASLAAMRELGAHDIRMHSVSGRRQTFAIGHGVPLISHDEYELEVALADVIVTCTTSSGFALDAAIMQQGRATASRSDLTPPRQQVLIDLGLPRNIDPDTATVDRVHLLDLETVRIHAPIDELSAVAAARNAVRAAATRYATKARSQDVAPSIVAVRQFVRTIVDDEVDRLRSRGRVDADTERALQHLGSVLMHRLTAQGQQLAASGESQRWVDGVEAVLAVTARPISADVDKAQPHPDIAV
jgi:glutamyl-tRNA reductase